MKGGDESEVVAVLGMQRRKRLRPCVDLWLMTSRSLSWTTMQILVSLVQHPDIGCYGYQISKETGVRSGTLYPMLARLADAGLTISYVEDVDPATVGRPLRRYHKLTADGVIAANAVIHSMATSIGRVGVGFEGLS